MDLVLPEGTKCSDIRVVCEVIISANPPYIGNLLGWVWGMLDGVVGCQTCFLSVSVPVTWFDDSGYHQVWSGAFLTWEKYYCM